MVRPKTRRHRRHLQRLQYGGTTQTRKEKPRCQCMDYHTGEGCKHDAEDHDVFCNEHRDCPPPPQTGNEPVYDNTFNESTALKECANCFAYAFHAIDKDSVEKCKRKGSKNCREFFPQPGALSGDRHALNSVERRKCSAVEKLMMADVPGITKSSFYAKCPAGTSKIALVTDPGEDYHFYRQDAHNTATSGNVKYNKQMLPVPKAPTAPAQAGGMGQDMQEIGQHSSWSNLKKQHAYWSHKDGSNKTKRYDALYQPIFNPQYISRDYRWQGSDLNYEDFCGFYCVPRDRRIHLGQGGSIKAGGGSARSGARSNLVGVSWKDHPSRRQRRLRRHRTRRL